jgi:Putative beta-barrel porin-2, OmpL-like. bbp2
VFQFYVQVGAYALPSLGFSNVRSTTYDDETYGYLPNAFVKFAPTSSFNIMVGKLPTLLGDETTFTFQNMNIERGLLWNQENVVNRGIQANYSKGPFTLSVALSDGFYSNRYTWLTGLLTYAITPQDSITIAGGGNFDKTSKNSFVSPLLYNNSQIYNVILTHTKGPFMISPYFQYTVVPANPAVGITHDASTTSAAILTKYSFTPAFSVAARGEVISSTGGNVTSLLYGPSSDAYSFTITPTYTFKIFFVRAEFSYTKASNITPGFGFGPFGNNSKQMRGLLETGVLF